MTASRCSIRRATGSTDADQPADRDGPADVPFADGATSRVPPRIGLTTYRDAGRVGRVERARRPAAGQPTPTPSSAAGGVPLLLPPVAGGDPDVAAGAVLDGLHGLVLAGGADVDPARYGAARDPHTGAPRPDRDAWEIALAPSRAGPRPCRCWPSAAGMQVLNVALGGDLVQHLPDVVGNDAHCPIARRARPARGRTRGRQPGRPRCSARAPTSPPTTTRPSTGSAPGSWPTGWAADGTVEAVEHARRRVGRRRAVAPGGARRRARCSPASSPPASSYRAGGPR